MSVADRVPGVSEYGSVDPPPPSTESKITKLGETLLNEETKCSKECAQYFHLEMIARRRQ